MNTLAKKNVQTELRHFVESFHTYDFNEVSAIDGDFVKIRVEGDFLYLYAGSDVSIIASPEKMLESVKQLITYFK